MSNRRLRTMYFKTRRLRSDPSADIIRDKLCSALSSSFAEWVKWMLEPQEGPVAK